MYQILIIFILLLLASCKFTTPKTQTIRQTNSGPSSLADKCKLPKTASYQANVLPIVKSYCYSCHTSSMAMGNFVIPSYQNEAQASADKANWNRALFRIKNKTMPPTTMKPNECEVAMIELWVNPSAFSSPTPTATPTSSPTPNPTTSPTATPSANSTCSLPANIVYETHVRPIFQKTCFACHGNGFQAKNINYEQYTTTAQALAAKSLFQDGLTQINAGMMPLSGAKPTVCEVSLIQTWLALSSPGITPTPNPNPTPVTSTSPYSCSMQSTDPGRVTLHRLNNTEYNNTVRDLLGTSLRPADAFPSDSSGTGFANNADNLAITPVFMEQLASAAEALANAVVNPASTTSSLIPCSPLNGNQTNCATQTLSSIATRAYRRPVTTAEVNRLVTFVTNAVAEGDTFQVGINNALQAILISPDFLFRVELDINPNDPNSVKSLSPYELASRLSYFLWSTMPDAELFTAAQNGTILNDSVLDAQVTRMLASSKARALTDGFGSEWLHLKKLDTVQPNSSQFPTFNATLRSQMRTETEMFFQAILNENRSITEFIDANFTFINNSLATHYSLSGVTTSTFQRVTLPPEQRGGVLTHASLLTANSKPNGTSPVLRGKFVLSELLCSEPPPPPANVTDLQGTVDPTAPKRVQLAQHTANPVCASCHKMMDPIGLGFENFDGIGRWRTIENGYQIDPSGTLPPDKYFANSMQLKGVLKTYPSLPNCVAEKITSYAIGRDMSASDRCQIGELTMQTAANNHRFVDIIRQVVKSNLFRKRRGEAP